nr:MAG TPA: hypothetical protein [Caudoviricetes sp.]
MKLSRSGNVAYHIEKTQYIVGENMFLRYIVDKPVNMCITKERTDIHGCTY